MTTACLSTSSTSASALASILCRDNSIDQIIAEEKNIWLKQLADSHQDALIIPSEKNRVKKRIYLFQDSKEPKIFIELFRLRDGARTCLWDVVSINNTFERGILAETISRPEDSVALRCQELLHRFPQSQQILERTLICTQPSLNKGEFYEYRYLSDNGKAELKFMEAFSVLDMLKSIVDVEIFVDTMKDYWLNDFTANQLSFRKIPKIITGGKFAVFIVKDRSSSKIKIFIDLGSNCFIGKGSMKVVTKALDYFENSKIVAIAKTNILQNARFSLSQIEKAVQTEEEILQMFPGCPHILQTTYIGYRSSPRGYRKQYLFLPYYAGGNLKSLIPTLTIAQKNKIAPGILKSYELLHDRGWCHQDSKPDNILLTEDLQPVLTDFGLSRKLTENLGTFGTTRWMSPEKLRFIDLRDDIPSEFGQAIDVWAVGLILYNLFVNHETYRKLAHNVCEVHPQYYRTAIASAYTYKYKSETPLMTTPLQRLIHEMMNIFPRSRPTASIALQRMQLILNPHGNEIT